MSASIKQGFRSWVAANTTGATVMFGKQPQGTARPSVTIFRTGLVQPDTMGGVDNSYKHESFDCQCRAVTAEDAESLADELSTALEALNGTISSRRCVARIENMVDDYEPPIDGSDVGDHVVTISVLIETTAV